MSNHTSQLKLAYEAGYQDTKTRGEYRPQHSKCSCMACRQEYLKGSDAAIRKMIGKRH